MRTRSAFLLVAALVLGACGSADSKFDVGEYVQSKLSGQKGMIVRKYCQVNGSPCSYTVRFLSPSITTVTRIPGPDDPITISPFSTIRMGEYELEKYVEK